ncbi:MAG: folate-binding protein YgfZ [Alphaproteobacteria bacterium]|nr:folate-binding protein YgfZ [Alphaproteobacteria bacterium]
MVLALTDRAVIAVSGPEARAFLQGLITNDVEKVAPGRALYAALLTPQGKILFDFLVSESDGTLLLDCRREAREALMTRLSLYKLRAKVEIKARDDLGVFAALDGESLPDGFADPRLPALGMRAIATEDTVAAQSGAETYQAFRLGIGVPEGCDFGSDKMFALDAGLDELHGVSFDKGCYVGQELTARMKHRGTARKRLLPLTTSDATPLAPGKPVTADAQEIGTVASVYGSRGFATIRLDRLAKAPFEVEGREVKVSKPSWHSP